MEIGTARNMFNKNVKNKINFPQKQDPNNKITNKQNNNINK